MSEKYQLAAAESDQDDEDYLPPQGQSSASEEESATDDESLVDTVCENDVNFATQVQKRSKKLGNKISKRVKNQSSVSNEAKILDAVGEHENQVVVVVDDEAQKKKTDSLWADFLKDSALVAKAKSKDTNHVSEKSGGSLKSKIDNNVKTSTIKEFACEKIDVEIKALLNTTQHQLSTLKPENTRNDYSSSIVKNNESIKKLRATRKTGVGGGISAVLGRLEKKTKINTLEKSKMDWDNFKKQEDIEEEINSHNKGKDGYLERQDFLQRADFRQFEIEKQLRNSSRRSNR